MSGEGSELPEGEKNFEKKLKKPLTNSPKSDRIRMLRGRTGAETNLLGNARPDDSLDRK